MPKDSGSSTTYDLPEFESYINAYLNGTKYMGYDLTDTYYETISEQSKRYISKHWFNVGSVIYSISDLSTTISEEKAYKWQGNIGLINVSDYIKASNNSSCLSEKDAISDSYPCKDNNYLFDSKHWWTISPYSNASSHIRFIYSNGDIRSNRSYFSSDVRPVLYLKSDIRLVGNGTESFPYVIVAS
jgi:hypothetical protein